MMPPNYLPRNEYFAQLYKIPVSAGVLVFDDQHRLLLLKTTYRDGYIIPGGMVEAGESPAQAALREGKEETGLTMQLGSLLCIDYKPRINDTFDDATLQLIFDGGTLSPAQIEAIQLDENEHSGYVFASVDEALGICNPMLAERLKKCFQARRENSCYYLKNGSQE